FRNMWFHTGDRAWYDEDGYFYFLDRIADAIRRRGENISAFDIECEINLHPAVLESAAFGVPSDLGEQAVKVAVVLRPRAGPAPRPVWPRVSRRSTAPSGGRRSRSRPTSRAPATPPPPPPTRPPSTSGGPPPPTPSPPVPGTATGTGWPAAPADSRPRPGRER